MRRGVTVCVFPEGTTFRGDEVRPFLAGAFVAALRERAEVLPVGLAYERADLVFADEPVVEHLKRLARTHPIRVGVAVGAPVTCSASRSSTFAEDMRVEVEALVQRARKLVGGSP